MHFLNVSRNGTFACNNVNAFCTFERADRKVRTFLNVSRNGTFACKNVYSNVCCKNVLDVHTFHLQNVFKFSDTLLLMYMGVY